MNRSKKSPSTTPSRKPHLNWLWLGMGMGVVVLLVFALWPGASPPPPASASAPSSKVVQRFEPASDRAVYASYAGSGSCRECHAGAYAKWTNSHHALAERPVQSVSDLAAFHPPRTIPHATQTSRAEANGERLQLLTRGLEGQLAPFSAERVLGVTPLRQFLFAAPGGRWQVGELAYDPRTNDWFDVFGDEDRQAGEWGHWTGRGMTWNSMCASCHNTRLRKNYDPVLDRYDTARAEWGVGCESCHGPLRAHVDWQRSRGGSATNDSTVSRLDRNQILDNCGSCHARRGELTGDFTPGQKFFDHFSLAIPDDSDLWYPDGQVRDENYEFTSFLGSKMHAAGVRCQDCHDSHSGRNHVSGNALCLRCHALPVAPAPKIDPVAHSHHREGTPGSLCVDCHMPLTTYMQRHPRRDHGFTIPDPLLTKEHQIPNACNRCHADKSVDWALTATEQWYGQRMERPSRTRARWIAGARAGTTNSPGRMLKLLAEEKVGLWRGSATRLLRPWNQDPAVRAGLYRAVVDADPIVRAGVAHALEGAAPIEDPALQAVLRELSQDSSRSVRVAAAWLGRRQLDTNSLAGSDLLWSLRQNLDQPAGQHQFGLWHFDRGQPDLALPHLQRTVAWDSNSPPFRHSLAVVLSTLGRPGDAVEQLQAACRIVPRDAEFRYQLGLAFNEAGRVAESTAALEEAVKLDPQLAPAWYNLGLAYSAAQNFEPALDALLRAETLQPESPRAPYARATILARLGRGEEARISTRRVLQIQPGFPGAAELLRLLEAAPK